MSSNATKNETSNVTSLPSTPKPQIGNFLEIARRRD
jgi:hypothetical protein